MELCAGLEAEEEGWGQWLPRASRWAAVSVVRRGGALYIMDACVPGTCFEEVTKPVHTAVHLLVSVGLHGLGSGSFVAQG